MRAGLNIPDQWWPTVDLLEAYAAAGFEYVQVHAPPRSVLRDADALRRHEVALRDVLSATMPRLVIHAPDSLRVGCADHDRAFEGLAELARFLGAEFVVYHALNVPERPGESPEDLHERVRSEERSLQRLIGRFKDAGATLALENLAPVHPGPPRLCHRPEAVAQLAESLSAGVCFDIGHANIVADAAGVTVRELLEPVLDRVALFHVHDNLGARLQERGQSTFLHVDPVRLDLHLPAGRGTVDWEGIAPLLAASGAPLQLEIHPSFGARPKELAESLPYFFAGAL